MFDFIITVATVTSGLVSCGVMSTAMALPVAFGLAALPLELLLRIVRLLDVRSVVRLSAASQQFRAATADWTLWRHLCRRDFPGEARGHATTDDDVIFVK